MDKIVLYLDQCVCVRESVCVELSWSRSTRELLFFFWLSPYFFLKKKHVEFRNEKDRNGDTAAAGRARSG
jgi:hypothetical protein